MRITPLVLSLLLVAGILAIPIPSHAQVAVGISVRIGPPALPVYAQPICPGPGYIWVPGYWAYGDDGYFWVPGTWVLAPEPGLLWTPGYWGWNEGFYVWHGGYWGPTVGFYGGINYGFGYTGVGFFGGYWRGGNYYYNRSVTNVNVTVIRNVYENRVEERNVTRVSFNGGPGGIDRRPDRDELRAEHERHISMTSEQNRHFEGARGDRRFLASVNHGRPEVAATPRSGEFRGRGEEHGREANMNRSPDNRGESNRPDRARENNGRNRDDRPPSTRHPDNPSSNPRLEEKHQREFDKMQRQQDAEHQKMQRQHDQAAETEPSEHKSTTAGSAPAPPTTANGPDESQARSTNPKDAAAPGARTSKTRKQAPRQQSAVTPAVRKASLRQSPRTRISKSRKQVICSRLLLFCKRPFALICAPQNSNEHKTTPTVPRSIEVESTASSSA